MSTIVNTILSLILVASFIWLISVLLFAKPKEEVTPLRNTEKVKSTKNPSKEIPWKDVDGPGNWKPYIEPYLKLGTNNNLYANRLGNHPAFRTAGPPPDLIEFENGGQIAFSGYPEVIKNSNKKVKQDPGFMRPIYFEDAPKHLAKDKLFSGYVLDGIYVLTEAQHHEVVTGQKRYREGVQRVIPMIIHL